MAEREEGRVAQGGSAETAKFVALGTSCSTRFKEIRDIFMGTCQIKRLPRRGSRLATLVLLLLLSLLLPLGCLCRSVDNKSGHIILKFPARGLQC